MRSKSFVPALHALFLAGSLPGLSSAEFCGTNDRGPSTDGPALRVAQSQDANQTYHVDVYFHAVSTQANKDRITDEALATQFDVLHGVYLRHGFELALVNTSRVVDDEAGGGFYNEDSTIGDYDAYLAFFKDNRVGNYNDLNVYFFSDLLESLGGKCDLPTPTAADPNNTGFWTDGCTVNSNTLPGMPSREDDSTDQPRKGHIAVHEVGHWFGLLHTFSGQPCDNFNDQVDDTPAQSGGSAGCPMGRDSCPDIPGVDPIHNFMDYADDTWYVPAQLHRSSLC